MKTLRKLLLDAAMILVVASYASDQCYGDTVSSADRQKRRQAMASSDRLIVPGERIGPIRLGMGMDEVLATLGHPDFSVTGSRYQWLHWKYWSLNMVVYFSGGAAPSVSAIDATCWGHGGTMGTTYWSKMEPPTTIFKTANGVGLGSSSFEVQRAYRSYSYDDQGVWMYYKELGVNFKVTNDQDHRIYQISISSPQ